MGQMPLLRSWRTPVSLLGRPGVCLDTWGRAVDLDLRNSDQEDRLWTIMYVVQVSLCGIFVGRLPISDAATTLPHLIAIGYDMEDAMILNKSSVDRGLAHALLYKTEMIDLREEKGKKSVLEPEPHDARSRVRLPSLGQRLLPLRHCELLSLR